MGDALRTLTADGTRSLPALISLVLFFVIFVGVVVWTFRKGSKETYDEAKKLPFEDRDAEEHGRAQS